MSSELVYRMRTCAAALLAGEDVSLVHRDATELLVEAANLLDAYAPDDDDLGEPMQILQPVKPSPTKAVQMPQGASWDTPNLPTQPFDFGAHNPKPCPACGSIDARKVRIEHKKLMLICPRCGHHWEYSR